MAKLAILIVLLLLLAFAAGDSFAALNFHNVAASRHEQPHLLKNRRRSGHGRLRSYRFQFVQSALESVGEDAPRRSTTNPASSSAINAAANASACRRASTGTSRPLSLLPASLSPPNPRVQEAARVPCGCWWVTASPARGDREERERPTEGRRLVGAAQEAAVMSNLPTRLLSDKDEHGCDERSCDKFCRDNWFHHGRCLSIENPFCAFSCQNPYCRCW
ncbi:hypothetical protein AXF42_Ash010625 [Apostasia shenzhenica]|uniref:ShKT domain-containing protein n=1 Tax=Apostasia shenzhenica TaxID=1088818 RepID=A0A2I0A6N1_9ASPA|nr:hypothetical protein AXF42_Ash010625 [Apostasia shenzhenica]